MKVLHALRLSGWCGVLLALLATSGLSPGAAGPSEKPEKPESYVYRLKYLKSDEAQRILRDLLGQEVGPKGDVRISTEERSNSLIVSGRVARIEQIAAILQKLDTPSSAAPEAPRPAVKVEQRIFRLRFISATDAHRILRELLGLATTPRADLRIAVDDRSNSLIVAGTAARLNELEAILGKIDTESSAPPESPRSEIKLVSLAGLEADKGVEDMLRLVFAGDRGRFVVNRQLGIVMLTGDQISVEKAVVLLEQLASLGRRKGDFAATELQVRIFWVVSGGARKDAAALPEGLEAVTAELSRLGMNKPSLATQVALRTVPGGKFESGSVVELAVPWDLSVSGTVAEKNGKVDLQLTTSLSQTSRRASRRVATLRTQTTISLDQPTVVGVIPTVELTSAYVVQVSHRPAGKDPLKEPGKRAAFEFRNKPWGQVFEWLSDTTGLPVVGVIKPTGSFTFIPPDANKRYTLPQIMDILNEALLQQKMILLRRERSITILPADEKPELIPRVQPQDFKNYGETELVSVLIPLRTLVAEDVAPDVKKMLGPFGNVAALKAANSLQVDDMVVNVRRVAQMILEVEGRDRK
jgi:hypothetical protein